MRRNSCSIPSDQMLSVDVKLLPLCKEEPHDLQDWSSSVEQEDTEPPCIKEEGEELWISQEEQQLQEPEEADIIKFTFSPDPVKSEGEEEEPQSSQLQEIQAEQMETGADGEDCGEPEQTRNSYPERRSQPEIEVKIEDFSEPETDDSADWRETRKHKKGSNSVENSQNKGKQSEKKLHSCSVCGKIFSQKGHLTDHMRIHTGEKPFVCSVCGKSFNHQRSLMRHTLVHTREKLFTCQLCGKKFSQKENMIRHMRIHAGDKPFSCSECGKRFNVKSGLTAHMTNHRGEQPFSCSECGKRFNTKGNLTQHMLVHTGEKLFSCSHCVKRFKFKSCLIRHMAHHKEEKPFSCCVCEQRFYHQSQLEMHKCSLGEASGPCRNQTKDEGEEGRHLQPVKTEGCPGSEDFKDSLSERKNRTDTKSHSCSLCGKTFKKKHGLIRHVRVHTGEKPFSCSDCGKRFNLKGNLTQHMVIHTSEKPYSCSLCHQKFSWHKLLRKHKCVSGKTSEILFYLMGNGEAGSGADGEDYGGSEQAWNPETERHFKPEVELNCSEPETEDNVDVNETREHVSGLNSEEL